MCFTAARLRYAARLPFFSGRKVEKGGVPGGFTGKGFSIMSHVSLVPAARCG